MTAVALTFGGIISFFILSVYWKGRSQRFKFLLLGCFFSLFLIAAFLCAALGVARLWYVAGAVPILCSLPAAFISLLIMPYSLEEATQSFRVPDYMGMVDPDAFLIPTLNKLPAVNHKGEAMHTLLRVLYVINPSRKRADVVFRQVMKTAVSLYDARDFTKNSVFFAVIMRELGSSFSDREAKRHSDAIRCAANLAYETILSSHHNKELTN